MIHQELNLVPHLSVAENIFLAREPRRGLFVDRAQLRANAQRCLSRLGVERAWVVHGSGLDEIALHGETLVAEVRDGNVVERRVTPFCDG